MIALLTTSALALVLSIAAPPPEPANFEDALSQLESAIGEFMNRDRERAIAALERALRQVSQFPDGPRSGQPAPKPVIDGWVILAGLYLAERDLAAANAAMDEAIRTARGQPLAVQSYGPKVSRLYQERLATLKAAGTAEISVECELVCSVVINERLLPGTREQLLLGSYRVWVKPLDDEDSGWQAYTIELANPNTVVVLAPTRTPRGGSALAAGVASTAASSSTALESTPGAGPLHAGPPSPTPSSPPQRDQTEPKPQRLLPRGAEIAGLTVGVGMLIAGAVLLSFDDKCENDHRRPTATTSAKQCGDIYETSAAGLSLLGTGGVVLATATAFLIVDEVRVGRARSPRVTVGLTWRF